MKAIHNPGYIRLISGLKARRLQLGMRQEVLARRLGVTNKWVSKVELRDIRLDVLAFVRICRVLGVRASKLVAQLEEESSNDDPFSYLSPGWERAAWRPGRWPEFLLGACPGGWSRLVLEP